MVVAKTDRCKNTTHGHVTETEQVVGMRTRAERERTKP